MGNNEHSSSNDKDDKDSSSNNNKERTWRDACRDELVHIAAGKVMTDTGNPYMDIVGSIIDKYENKKDQYKQEARELATKEGPEALKEFEEKQKDLDYYDEECSL